MMPPTKEQHDVIVERKGRPYTDDGMRHAIRDDIPLDQSIRNRPGKRRKATPDHRDVP